MTACIQHELISDRRSSPPEVFHSVEGVDCPQCLAPVVLILRALWVIKPQCPLVFQGMLLREVWLPVAFLYMTNMVMNYQHHCFVLCE